MDGLSEGQYTKLFSPNDEAVLGLHIDSKGFPWGYHAYERLVVGHRLVIHLAGWGNIYIGIHEAQSSISSGCKKPNKKLLHCTQQ